MVSFAVLLGCISRKSCGGQFVRQSWLGVSAAYQRNVSFLGAENPCVSWVYQCISKLREYIYYLAFPPYKTSCEIYPVGTDTLIHP